MWYRTGTISLTNGSINVLGSGTAFIKGVKQGFVLVGPDGKLYEVSGVTSNANLTITPAYQGTTISSTPVAIFQTQGKTADLTSQVAALIAEYEEIKVAYDAGELGGSDEAIDISVSPTGSVSATNVQSAITELDTDKVPHTKIQTTPLDGTPGQLLTVGSFGLGSTTHPDYTYPNLDNDPTVVRAGLYRVLSSMTNNPAGPDTGTLLVTRYSPTVINFLYQSSTGVIYTRQYSASSWTTAWKRQYNSVDDDAGATITVNGNAPDLSGNISVPSDVQEFTNLAAFPSTGVTNRLYIANDTFKPYKWNAATSTYVLLVPATVGRTVLTAHRTFYVRTDGNDSNDGSANTAGSAFKTPQKALNVIKSTIDLGGFNATVQLADGTYGDIDQSGTWTGAGNVIVAGNYSSPANVTLGRIIVWYDCKLYLGGIRLVSTGSFTALWAKYRGYIQFLGRVIFGAGYSTQVLAEESGIVSIGNQDYTIDSGAAIHIAASTSARVYVSSGNLTVTGTPAFTDTFINVERNAEVTYAAVFFMSSGTFTGKRYNTITGGGLYTGGATTILPGTVAGTTTAPGWYA